MRQPRAKYSVGDTVRVRDSSHSTCSAVIQKVEYEESNSTYYYTVSDNDRSPFQVHEVDILTKMERIVITDLHGKLGLKGGFTKDELIAHIKALEDEVFGKNETTATKFKVGDEVYVVDTVYFEGGCKQQIFKAVVRRIDATKCGMRYLLLREGEVRPHHWSEVSVHATYADAEAYRKMPRSMRC